MLGQLGINWQLFLSQAVNFFLLLGILTFFLYKPLMKVLKERTQKIKEGLEKAEEADVRLKQVDEIAKEKIKQADQDSIAIIKKTEANAKVLAGELAKKSEERQKEILKQIEQNKKKQEEEAREMVLKGAAELIKKTIIKTVELSPDKIDEALIKKAISQVKEEK